MSTLSAAKEKYELKENIPLSVMTAIDGLFTIEDDGVLPDGIEQLIIDKLDHVCQAVIIHREKEGQFLIQDVEQRLEKLNDMLKVIQEKQSDILERYQERILTRVEDHVGNKINIDDNQLIKEIAMLAEKGDITEEITRLFSHMSHFSSVIKNEQPVGRKLDFITQEMHREINTIGAKSIEPDLSEAVVIIKSELEKIKEQIQNIE